MLISDIDLPGDINGVALAVYVAEKIPNLSVPVISAMPRAELVERCDAARWERVLSKPLRRDELFEAIWHLSR